MKKLFVLVLTLLCTAVFMGDASFAATKKAHRRTLNPYHACVLFLRMPRSQQAVVASRTDFTLSEVIAECRREQRQGYAATMRELRGGSSRGSSGRSSSSSENDPYGGSGGGFAGAGVCTNGTCTGPHGTTVCTNGTCTGPGGTTVCTNGTCTGPSGTTVCTNGTCTGPGGTTVCTNGTCN